MRDKDAKKRPTRISLQAGEANTSTELSETELKDVTGGKVTMQDFYLKMNKIVAPLSLPDRLIGLTLAEAVA